MGFPANGGPPRVAADAVPWVTVAQMREVDRLMVEEFGIDLARMMENAGRSLAVVARWMLGGDAAGRRVLVLAGPGGNGGGGLTAARHLHVAGALVEVALAAEPAHMTGVPGEQLAILHGMGVPFATDVEGRRDLVVDAVSGYGLAGPPSGRAAELIASTAGRRVLSLDVPSGLELATGVLHAPAVRAEATVTLAAPKTALRTSGATGRLLLADISVPSAVWGRLSLPAPRVFGMAPVVEISPV